jgi:hypothetical protein
MYTSIRGRTLVVSSTYKFLKSFKHRKINIDINDLVKYKEELTNLVKEKHISNIIHNYKLQMDNIPFLILRDLCETLTLYDAFENYYDFNVLLDEEYVKNLNKQFCKVSYIPKKIKAQIVNDKLELLKRFQDPNMVIDAREHLILFRALVLKFFLQDSQCRENLFKIQDIYVEKKRTHFKKYQIFNKKSLKKGTYYQPFVDQILKFYFHNKLYYETMTDILPIIGYKNHIPVLNPELFGLSKQCYSLRELKLINITYMMRFA